MAGNRVLEQAAFQAGAWRGWGLAIVFIAGIVALFLSNALADWAIAAWMYPEARSLPGLIALLSKMRHDPMLLAAVESPVKVSVAVSIRSLAAVATVYCLRGLLPASSMRSLGFIKPTASQIGFGAGVGILALFAAGIVQWIWTHFVGSHVGPWPRIIAGHHGPLAYALDILQASLVSPIAEETLFRGLLFAGLAQRMAPLPAALASSILFGLWHFEPYALPTLTTFGLFQAWVYYRARNIWAPIATHGVVNFVLFTLLYLRPLAHAGHPS